jgi:hypothetical protein
VRADELEQTMKAAGWAYLLGLFLQFRIGDRSILLPFFAAACVVQLGKMRRSEALRSSPRFTATWVTGWVTVVAGFAAWLPSPVGGTASAAVGGAIFAGSALYAESLRDWSVAQGWEEPARRARSATWWLGAVGVLFAVALLALVVLVDPGPANPMSGYQPSTMFGRPLEGWAPGVVLVAISVVMIVGLVKLRGAQHLIRHSLRAQADPLVAVA